MTNKTQIAELAQNIIEQVADYGAASQESFDLAMKTTITLLQPVFNQLEAAEARNALVAGGIEAAVKLQERAEKAEAELAKLKGDAVPVAWIMGDEEIDDFNRGREVMIVRDNDETELPSIPLFTHAQPVPVDEHHPDKVRMDWLCAHVVQVREPLFYGSHEMFWAQADSDDDEEYHTTLREQVDAAIKSTYDRKCQIPPTGWRCSREVGHEGPCAAWPVKSADGEGD